MGFLIQNYSENSEGWLTKHLESYHNLSGDEVALIKPAILIYQGLRRMAEGLEAELNHYALKVHRLRIRTFVRTER